MKTTIRQYAWMSPLLMGLVLMCATSCGSLRRSSTIEHHTHRSGRNGADTVWICSVNDMHASIDRFPRLAYVVDSLRQHYPDLILVSAGDNQSGNPINDATTPKGWPIISLMNELRFDVSAVGNHEFDSTQRGFEWLTQHADFPFISANITVPDTLDMYLSPWHMIRTERGIRVGIVSLIEVSPVTGIPASHPNNVVGFAFQDPLDVGPSLQHYADSCDLLVYLTHIGYEDDQRLAQLLDHQRVPLIIGGHSHTYVQDGDYHNGILVTQAEAKLSYLSLTSVVLVDKRVVSTHTRHIAIGDRGTKDHRIAQIVSELNDAPYFNQVIATTPTRIEGKEQIGYLMTDALRSMTGADIALVNGGGVRISKLDAGAIKVKDVYSMDPFGNSAQLFEMTASDIAALVQSALESDSYLFIIPSGMHIRYYEDDEDEIERFELLDESNRPLDPHRKYLVAMNSYMPAAMSFPNNQHGRDLNVTTASLTVEYLERIKEWHRVDQRRFVRVVEPVED